MISGAGFPSARTVPNERFSVVVGAVLQTNPARSTNQGGRLGLIICICSLRRHHKRVYASSAQRSQHTPRSCRRGRLLCWDLGYRYRDQTQLSLVPIASSPFFFCKIVPLGRDVGAVALCVCAAFTVQTLPCTASLIIEAMASCASCGKQSNALKTCTACKSVKYCGRECQTAHRKEHRKACKKRARELAEEAELISVLKDATMKPVGEDSPYLPVVDLPPEGACCWICLGEGDDEHGMPLMRDCACRGDAGFSHPLCIAKYCRQKCDRIDAGSRNVQASLENWADCHNCKMQHRGLLGLGLAEAHMLAVKNKMPNDLEVFGAKKDLGCRLIDGANQIRDRRKNGCALARKDLRRALHIFEEQVKILEAGLGFDQQTTMCLVGDALKKCARCHQWLGEVDNELSCY